MLSYVTYFALGRYRREGLLQFQENCVLRLMVRKQLTYALFIHFDLQFLGIVEGRNPVIFEGMKGDHGTVGWRHSVR